MKNFKCLFLMSLLVFAGNCYAVSKSNISSISQQHENSFEDQWDKVTNSEKQKKARKRMSIKNDLLVIGTIIVGYVLGVHIKIVQLPTKTFQNFYKNYCEKHITKKEDKKLFEKPILIEKDKDLLKDQECLFCYDKKQCVKYCNNCYANNFVCFDCINKTVHNAAWIYKENKPVKNIKCPYCFGSLNACFDEKYLYTNNTNSNKNTEDFDFNDPNNFI